MKYAYHYLGKDKNVIFTVLRIDEIVDIQPHTLQ